MHIRYIHRTTHTSQAFVNDGPLEGLYVEACGAVWIRGRCGVVVHDNVSGTRVREKLNGSDVFEGHRGVVALGLGVAWHRGPHGRGASTMVRGGEVRSSSVL